MDNKRRNVIIARRSNTEKGNSALHPWPDGSPKPTGRLSAQFATDCVQNELTRVRRLRLSMQRELELAKQMRFEAEKYRLETETKARSEAQRLILENRLAIRKKISKLESETSEQLKKVFIDIRMIRLAAQEELEAQRQFTNAAKISALSLALHDETKQTSEE